MNNKFFYNLNGIYLGGFQVFDEVNFIPLRRLTFLYGPNSAGKSAVEDGLSLIQKEFFDHNGRVILNQKSNSSEDFISLLNNSWRRESDELDSYALECTLGFQFVCQTNISCIIHTNNFERQPSKYAKEIEAACDADYGDVALIEVLAKYRHYDVNGEEENISYTHPLDRGIERTLNISINGTWIAESQTNKYVRLNFKHPIFLYFQPEVDFNAISNKYPDIFAYKNGSVSINNFYSEEILNNNLVEVFRLISSTRSFSDDVDPAFVVFHSYVDRPKPLPTDLEKAIFEFAYFFNELHYQIAWSTYLKILTKVDASRKTPSIEDLCFVKSEDSRYKEMCSNFGIASTGNPIYEALAWDLSVRERVNHLFTEHLFIERGYVITDERLDIKSDQTKIAEMIRLCLEDSEKRKFSLSEVGSGLGYILPVLCVLASDQSMDESFAFIQQPELHLHPALQSSLGDVFIESSTKKGQFVIETHSEHILLRVLKRVRQTKSNLQMDVSLQIHPEEISILYFDPSPTGKSKVKHIRIGEDGDFLDRWPRGFFAERDEDLFDE